MIESSLSMALEFGLAAGEQDKGPSLRLDLIEALMKPSLQDIIDRGVRERIEGKPSLEDVIRAGDVESIAALKDKDFDAAMFFHGYLQTNAKEAATRERMKGLIARFERRAPPMAILACMDGRMHGSKGPGYPPGTVKPIRTDGAIVKTEGANHSFWNDMNELISSAPGGTRVKPPLFIAFAHRVSMAQDVPSTL